MGSPVTITPDQQAVTITPDPSGAGHAIGEDIGPAAKGLAFSLLGPPYMAYQSIKKGLADFQSVKDTGKTTGQIHNDEQKDAGYGAVYRHLTTPLAENVGVNVRGMEDAASKGDEAGVLGHTIVPAAMATAPLIAEGATRASQFELPDVGAKARALTKLGAKEAISHIPIAGRAVQRPSFFDLRDAVMAKAPAKGPAPVFPSEPQGPQIPFELQQAAPLRRLPETGAKPASVTGEALGTLSKPKEFTLQDKPGAQPIPKSVASKALDSSLREAVGNKPVQPGVALKDQMKPVPEGHTPVESSAVRSFKYDAAQNEMHVHTPDGITYVFGDVTPEQMKAFQDAPSKGKAWKTIRDSSPLVAKVLKSGERISVKPTSFRSASPDDGPLLGALKESLKQAQAARAQR